MGNDPLSDLEQGKYDEPEFEADVGGMQEERAAGELQTGQDYVFRLIDVQFEYSQAGNPMWTWDFACVSDLKGNQDHAGKEMRYWTALTPSALFKVEEVMNALNVTTDDKGKAKFKKSDVVGVLVLGHVVESEYQGQKRPSLESVAPHPQGAGYRGAGGPGEPSGSGSPPSNASNSDIPF
jgi:hypothetical protein